MADIYAHKLELKKNWGEVGIQEQIIRIDNKNTFFVAS